MSEEQPTKFGGFPTPEKNFFPMPNEWINICAKIDSLAELKVVQYVLRHTWGYHEYGTPKPITTNEFMHGRKRADGTRIDSGTGLSNRSVIDGLKKAIEDGLLIVTVDDSDKARICKAYELRMAESDVKNLHTDYEKSRCEESSQQICNIFTADMKNVHSGGENSSQRSEKYTKEIHSRKTKRENALSSIDETRTPSSLSESNSSSSITESVASETPSQPLTDTTQPLTAEPAPSEPALPEFASQAQEKASAQAGEQTSGVSHSQSTAPSSQQDSAKQAPSEQPALIARPEKPEMPSKSMRWGPEKMVQIVEAYNEEYYDELQRPDQIKAAQKILKRGVKEEPFVQGYCKRNDAWWHEKKGKLHVTHMAANTQRGQMRILEVLSEIGGQSVPTTLKDQRNQAGAKVATHVGANMPPQKPAPTQEQLNEIERKMIEMGIKPATRKGA